MTDAKTLLRQAGHYVTGRAAVMALGFLSFPIFTRILSVAQYGTLSLVLKLAALVVVLAKAGLQNSILRFYEEHATRTDTGELRRFYSSILLGNLLISSTVALSLFAVLSVLPGSWMSDSLRIPLRWAVLYVVIKALESLLWAFLRVEGRTKLYNALDVAIKAGAIGVVCWILFQVERSVRAFVVGLTIVEGVAVLAVILFLVFQHLIAVQAFRLSLFRSCLAFGFPLIIYELAGILLDSGDRILVQYYLGAQMLGYYAAAYALSTAIEEALMTPLNLAMVPLYMKIWVNDGQQATQNFLSKGLNTYLIIATAVGGTAIVCSRDLMVVLGSRKLQEASSLLPLLIIGLLVYSTSIFSNAGLLIHKKTIVMVRITLAACVLNIVMNLILIPLLKLQAAAIATLVSYIFYSALMMRSAFQYLPLRIGWWRFARCLLAAAASGLLTSRIQVGPAFFSLVLKATVMLSLYAGSVWLVDPQVRERVRLSRILVLAGRRDR
jgi:O-antigen/teichoic acid export membrane protein